MSYYYYSHKDRGWFAANVRDRNFKPLDNAPISSVWSVLRDDKTNWLALAVKDNADLPDPQSYMGLWFHQYDPQEVT